MNFFIIFRQLTNQERLKLVLFIFFVLCILSTSLIFFFLSNGKPYLGIALEENEQGWIIQSLDAKGTAAEVGIQVGDKPVEINGQPAEVFLKNYTRIGTVSGHLIHDITVTNSNGQTKSVTLSSVTSSRNSDIELTSWFIVCVIFWISGIFTFFKKPRNVSALLFCLSALAFGLALSGNMAAIRAIPTAIYFEITATLVGPWLLFHFFLSLPEERIKIRESKLVYIIYAPAFITVILFPVIGLINGQPSPEFRTFRLFESGLGFIATIAIVIFNFLRTTSLRTRQQMKIVLIACLAALIPFLVLYVLPGTLWKQNIVPSGFNMLYMAFIPIGMGYAVVTQKLMDIDVVIRRGIIYGLVSIVMSIILAVGIFAALALRSSLTSMQEITLALLLAIVATVLFGPTKRGIEILVDKFFYKDRYDYRLIIQSLSTTLNSVKDFTDISRLIVGTIVHALNLAGGILFIKPESGSYEISTAEGIFIDKSKQEQTFLLLNQRGIMVEFPSSAMKTNPDVAFLIPLIAGGREVGVLCLSPKVTRQDFASSDIYLLQGIASLAASATYSALLVRDVSIRDTFVSVASHELRTPLTAIVGYADLLLRRDPPNATRTEWLKIILDNGQRLSSMVDDLLNVSRIQSGRVSISLEKVELSGVLEEALFLAKENTNEHTFVVEIKNDIPVVLLDHDKFRQVIGNLLSNAIKYSPKGGRVTLSSYVDKVERQVVVEVADEGIGISKEDRASLFTTFHRIQRPETQGIRGSGLGLYIAKEWTTAMGGKIRLESELNKGSRFFVAFPIRD